METYSCDYFYSVASTFGCKSELFMKHRTFRSVHFLLSFWRIITWSACVVPGLMSSWGHFSDNKSLYWERGSCRSQLPFPGPRNDPRPRLLNHWANSLLPLGIPLGSFWENNRLRNLSLMSLKRVVCVCVCVCVCVLVAQLCPILCDPMDCSPPGSSVRGILQARILEELAIAFSRGSSQPGDRTQVSCITGGFFTVWATREAKSMFILPQRK